MVILVLEDVVDMMFVSIMGIIGDAVSLFYSQIQGVNSYKLTYFAIYLIIGD